MRLAVFLGLARRFDGMDLRASTAARNAAWVPQDVNAEILARQPQKVRVLAIRQARGGLIGKLIIPTLAGVPVAVEQHGDRVRIVIRMARGMETTSTSTTAEGERDPWPTRVSSGWPS